MDAKTSIHEEATRALAACIREQTLCAVCGKPGRIKGKDSTTLLCGRCGLIEHGHTPDDVAAALHEAYINEQS